MHEKSKKRDCQKTKKCAINCTLFKEISSYINV